MSTSAREPPPSSGIRGVLRDASASAVVAGFVTVLVGFTGTAVVVLQAAQAVGADAAHQAS